MDSFVWELGGEEKRVCYYDFSFQRKKVRNDGFVCMGVGGEKIKECVYYDFSLQGEKDRNDGFLCTGVWGKEKTVCFYDNNLSD